MKLEHLRTLAVIADAGTFEAAAARLHLTPSAVSQRVKALEAEVGAVVLTRTTPATPTPAGEVLARLGRQVALLEDEARALLAHGTDRVDLPVAVNADSLATWLTPVLRDIAAWDDVTVRLMADDQDRTAEWLRTGTVLAAVTADPTPVAGCRAEPLGVLRYRACAHAELVRRWSPGGRFDLANAPRARFGPFDDMQHGFLRARGLPAAGPETWIPSPEAFNLAVACGVGWGLLPEVMLPGLHAAHPDLVVLDEPACDIGLVWQRWKVDSPALDRLTTSVRTAARAGLTGVTD